MTKYLRKNQKKVLAIFSVGLMVAFALPSMTSNSRRSETQVGTIDHGKVTIGSGEYNVYRSHWQALKRQFGPQALSVVLAGFDRVDEAIAVRALGDPTVSNKISMLESYIQQNPMIFRAIAQQDPELAMLANASFEGRGIYAQIDNNEELFPLLVKEAQMLGVGVNSDLIETILTARQLSHDADPDLYESMQQSLRSLLMVNNAAARAASVVKVSQPEMQNLLATQRQQIAVNLVEFAAKDFLDKVPAPTAPQLQAQFDKYKDREVGEGQMDFGYRYPNRVKYETIVITRDEVKKAVAPVQPEQLWEYYLRNQNKPEFVIDTTFTLDKAPAAANGPTTRPMTFDEAKEKITAQLTKERVEQLADKVRDAVRNTMRADYDAYKLAMGSSGTGTATTGPASAPAPVSSLGVAYNSRDYLKKLRDKVQSDFKVTLSIEQEEGWQTPKSLEESKAGKEKFATESSISFPIFLAQAVEPFLNENQKKQAAMMRAENRPVAVWEPTPVFRSAKEDLLIARATAADPSHVPATLDEVKERVTADVRTVGAFEKAKEAAQATLDTAKTKWLQSVANEQGRTMISTGLFSPSDAGRNGMGVIGYDVKGAALESFVQGAFKLLTLAPRSGEAPRPPATQATTQATTKPATRQQASTTKPAAATAPATSAPVITAFKDHPVGLIEVPAEAKVVVAEVDQVKPMWTKDRQAMWDTAIASQQRVSTEQLLRQAWFNYDHVVRRVSFVPAEKRDRKPPVEMPPPNPF